MVPILGNRLGSPRRGELGLAVGLGRAALCGEVSSRALLIHLGARRWAIDRNEDESTRRGKGNHRLERPNYILEHFLL